MDPSLLALEILAWSVFALGIAPAVWCALRMFWDFVREEMRERAEWAKIVKQERPWHGYTRQERREAIAEIDREFA